MWLFTRDGFMSAVVDKKNRRQIVVRARVKDDLTGLVNHCVEVSPNETKPKVLGRMEMERVTDYPFRVYVSRDQWETYVAKAAWSMDYDNFKDNCDKGEDDRHRAYMNVWSDMLDLEKHRKGWK